MNKLKPLISEDRTDAIAGALIVVVPTTVTEAQQPSIAATILRRRPIPICY